jgi:hypothetical protein
MITDAKMLVRCPDENLLPTDQREIGNNIERFCYGALTLQDDRYARLPGVPSLRSQIAWLACMRGQVALRVLIYKNDAGKTIVDFAAWDMYNVAYWSDDTGVCRAVHMRVASREELKSRFNYTPAGKTAVLYDCWDEEENAIACDDKWLKTPVAHGADGCPVYVIFAGSMPTASRQGVIDAEQYKGESILAENRLLYPMINKTLSDYLTIIRRGVTVPLGIWSSGGHRTLDIDPWQVEDGTIIPFDSDRGEKIEPLIEPTMPADADKVLSYLMSEEERGGFSPLALGMIDLQSRMSGYAINNLQSATAMKIIPFIDCVNRAYKVSLTAALHQYKAKAWKPIEVWGRTSKGQAFGVPQPIKISPADIEEDWNLDIELLPIFPKDDAQRYELARLATQGEKPLLSVKSAQENILGLDDTNLENEHIAGEWAEGLPLIRLLKSFKAAVADKDELKASTLLAEVRRVMAGLFGEPGQSPTGENPVGATANAPQALSRRMAGAPAAGGKTGLSPEVMPPEAMGSMPAGAANAR